MIASAETSALLASRLAVSVVTALVTDPTVVTLATVSVVGSKSFNAAIDAAVAVASMLNLTEPTSCGVGGDMFALYYDNSKKEVVGINGSGRSAKALTMEKIRQDGITGDSFPDFHGHTVTVPGAVAGWLDLLEKYGTKDRREIF